MAGLPKAACLLLSTALLAACSGGGGGGTPQTIFTATVPITPAPSNNAFTPGVFQDWTNFEAMCANPRSGIDPETSQPYPDAVGTTTDENNWLRSWSNDLYLWYDEIDDVNPASVADPLDYFDLMKTFELSPSGAEKDKFHLTYDTEQYRLLSQSGVSAGYGATFTITAAREVLVAYTEPDTPAIAAGLERGASVLGVDGVTFASASTDDDIDTISAGLFPGNTNESHEFSVRDPGGGTRSITMTSIEITSAPVQNVGTIDTASGKVGYLLFNDHIATAELALIDAVDQLAAEAIEDLVLDLRYNGGGYLAIASQLSYMIAGPLATDGKTFEELEFNDKYSTFNPVTGNQLAPTPFIDETIGFSATPEGQPLPSLDLPRVFVLSGEGTCSASEAIVNGLRGAGIEVLMFGETTCGKPYGFYAFDNCGTTYFSIQFRGINDIGFGDYTDGFSPGGGSGVTVEGCSTPDDFTKALGDPDEIRLATALEFRDTGTCPVGGTSPASLVLPPHPHIAFGGRIVKPQPLQNKAMIR